MATTEQTVAVTVNLKAFAEVVHVAITQPFMLTSEERSSILSCWDTLVDLNVLENSGTAAEAVEKIHDQVDAILAGVATVTLRQES